MCSKADNHLFRESKAAVLCYCVVLRMNTNYIHALMCAITHVVWDRPASQTGYQWIALCALVKNLQFIQFFTIMRLSAFLTLEKHYFILIYCAIFLYFYIYQCKSRKKNNLACSNKNNSRKRFTVDA